MRRPALAALVLTAACGGDGDNTKPTANPAREIIDTKLAFDVSAMTGTATITFGPSDTDGASVEVGDLAFDDSSVDAALNEKSLDLALPANKKNSSVDFAFHYKDHTAFDGAHSQGYTLLWPYFCGNLFPCHSDPADGTTFKLDVTGVPAGQTAVFPTEIASQAPSYMIAWSYGDYTEIPLGTTTAGTQVSTWHLPGHATNAMTGGAHLVAAFDWLEKTIGPYRFGNKVGTVDVAWGRGGLGGMEHHPYWHIGSGSVSDEETNVHEAAHGWYGDGIRIQCWEDFVLSEGTVSYLAARALSVVAPTVGAEVWMNYQQELATDVTSGEPVWPQSCHAVDIIADGLFSNAPYMRGAYFYKGIADKVGAEVLDGVLAAFYAEHAGGSATMQEMLDKIAAMTGYDPTACAQKWLKDAAKPAIGPCP